MSDFPHSFRNEIDERSLSRSNENPNKRKGSILRSDPSDGEISSDDERQETVDRVQSTNEYREPKKRKNDVGYWNDWYHKKGGRERIKNQRQEKSQMIFDKLKKHDNSKKKWNGKVKKEKTKHLKWKKRYRGLKDDYRNYVTQVNQYLQQNEQNMARTNSFGKRLY